MLIKNRPFLINSESKEVLWFRIGAGEPTCEWVAIIRPGLLYPNRAAVGRGLEALEVLTVLIALIDHPTLNSH